jgi:cytoskeletal protein CcmA (bactofilin family)
VSFNVGVENFMANNSKTMKTFLNVFVIFSMIFSMLPAPAFAVINEAIPFTGTLLDGDGDAVTDGTYDMTFRIYDAAAAGTCLYSAAGTCGTPTQITVTVTDGQFSIILGGTGTNALTGISFNDADRYLGILVETNAEMAPRYRLGATAYTYNADAVDGFSASAAATASTLLALDADLDFDLGAGDISATEAVFAGAFNANGSVTLGDASGDGVTFVGNIQGASPMSFDGASAFDTFETTFAFDDPTADRTITFKDETGTVAFLSDVGAAVDLDGAYGNFAANPSIINVDEAEGQTGGLEFSLDTATSNLIFDLQSTSDLLVQDAGVVFATFTDSGDLQLTNNLTVGAAAETLANAGFSLDGDDLFVAGVAGIEGNVYTDAAFVAGATTTYADGSITDTDANADDLFDFVLAAGADSLRVSTGNLRVGDGVPGTAAMDGEDAYIEGELEVDGAVTLDGSATISGTLAANGNITLGNAVTDSITANAAFQGTSPLILDGATDDTNEVTLALAGDPGADFTVTIPLTTGTLITTGDTGTVTGTMLLDGSVDISDDTNLVDGTNITLAGDTLNVDDVFLINTGDTATGDYDFTGAELQGATPLVFEGATAGDGFETRFTFADPSADRVITIPNSDEAIGTATVITDDLIVAADLADADWGDISVTTNVVTIDADAVALTTDTTGNYVASVTDGTGITGGDGGSEGAGLTLAVDQSFAPTWTGAHTFENNVTIGNAVTDNLTLTAAIQGSTAFILDGATDDTNEVSIVLGADPGADVTLTLPTATGTFALLSDITATSLTDNVADAYDLQEGTNNYININTTDASENISFGNATTNPSFSFLGTGVSTFTGGATSTGTLTANGTFDANGLVTIGDNGDTVAIDSSDWDISTTGDITGAGAITADGALSITDAANETALSVTSSATIANAFEITVDSLTTGNAAQISSDSADASTRNLLSLINDNTGAFATTPLYIRQDAGARAMYIEQNASNGPSIVVDSDAATVNTVDIFGPSTTTSNVIEIRDANSLTTGTILNLEANGSDASTRNLVNIVNDNAAATGATILSLQQDSAQRAFFIDQNGADNGIEIDHDFSDAGNVAAILVNTANAGVGDAIAFHADTGDVLFDEDLVVGGSTSDTETLSNAGFTLGGDDLFVAGTAGIEGDVYTDGSFIAGATTTLSDGSLDSSGVFSFNTTNNQAITTGTGLFTAGGAVSMNGVTLTMDADNAGAGADLDIIANQGSDSDGTLRYSAANDQWEISNDGGAFVAIATGSGTGTLDDAYDNGQSITVDASGDLVFNLTNTEDFVIQDAGTPFATFNDSGNVVFANEVTANGDLLINSQAHLADDIQLTFGNTAASPDAGIYWDSAGNDLVTNLNSDTAQLWNNDSVEVMRLGDPADFGLGGSTGIDAIWALGNDFSDTYPFVRNNTVAFVSNVFDEVSENNTRIFTTKNIRSVSSDDTGSYNWGAVNLAIADNGTNDTGTYYGNAARANVRQSAGTINSINGIVGEAWIDDGFTGTVSDARGGVFALIDLAAGDAHTITESDIVRAFATLSGDATIPALTIFDASATVGGATAVTDFRGLNVADPTLGGTGSVTTAYGVYVDDQTSATSDYGIYVAGADTLALWVDADDVRFDEDLVVGGSTSDTETLSNAGFTLGGDDLFVAGTAGIEGNIYTDAAFVAGSTTTYADGSITDTDANADDLFDFALAAGADSFRISTGNLRIGNGTPGTAAMDGEDLYVEGEVEIDGAALFDGTLTASSTIDLNGNLSIADTDIAFDGVSTTFTTTGAFTLTPGGAVILGDGGDTMAIDTSDWDISATGAITGVSFDANGTGNSISNVDLTADVTGTLPIANGGTGATTLNDLITLGTHTTGNYLATLADAGAGDITVTGSGSESAAVTLDITDDSLDFTELSDTLALDAATSITGTAGEIFSFARTLTDDTAENGVLLSVTASDTGAATSAQYGFYLDNLASTEGLDASIVIDNSDADDAVGVGLKFIDAGGGFTNLLELDDGTLLSTSELAALDGGISLDNAYDNGQLITVDASGDLVFNLNNTEDFVIQDAGTPFATFTDAGDLNLVNNLTVGTSSETIEEAAFALNGDDVFISDSLGIENHLYIDGNILFQDTLGIGTAGTIGQVERIEFHDSNTPGAATRFVSNGDDNFIYYKWDDTTTGGIIFNADDDGGDRTQGSIRGDGDATNPQFGFADKDGQFAISLIHDDYIQFSVDNDEKARIEDTGEFGIGTTTPGARLEVQVDDTDNEIGLLVDMDDSTNNPVALLINNAGTGLSLHVDEGDAQFDAALTTGGLLTAGTDLDIHGTLIELDEDNAGAGANVRLLANQGSDSDGEIRYNATTNQWELSNDGGAFEAISAGAAGLWEDGTNGVYEDDEGVIVGIDQAETLSNAGFTLAAGDLFVQDELGVEGDIFTDGAIDVVGAATIGGLLTANGQVVLGDGGDTVAINSSDWDISATGDITGAGAITADGLFTGTLGATISGAVINLNDDSNFAVNIATGTST